MENKWIKLSKIEKNECIGKLSGWDHINIDEPNTGYAPEQGMPGLCRLPDFINDLNAMNRAEKWAMEHRNGFKLNYPQILAKIITEKYYEDDDSVYDFGLYDSHDPTNYVDPFHFINASAEQRAEAFFIAMEGN